LVCYALIIAKGLPFLLSPFSLYLSYSFSCYFTPFFRSYNHLAIIDHVYAVYTIEVGVNNNKFEYLSANDLGYTMSHTSTCPITYLHQNKRSSCTILTTSIPLLNLNLSSPMREFIFLILVFTLTTLINWNPTFLLNQQIKLYFYIIGPFTQTIAKLASYIVKPLDTYD
jgi:hypothetical protein